MNIKIPVLATFITIIIVATSSFCYAGFRYKLRFEGEPYVSLWPFGAQDQPCIKAKVALDGLTCDLAEPWYCLSPPPSFAVVLYKIDTSVDPPCKERIRKEYGLGGEIPMTHI
jgi:hypothetical protein